MTDKLFTVVCAQYCDGSIDGIYPFVHVYRTKEDAIQAVEDSAQDDWNAMIDPNSDDPPEDFPGLEWNDAKTEAWDPNEDDRTVYQITEATLQR